MKLSEWLAADKARTQEKLAEVVTCSQPTIARIVAGGDTTTKLAKAICAATDWEVSLNDLLLNDQSA